MTPNIDPKANCEPQKSFPKATHDKRQFFPAFNKDEYSKNHQKKRMASVK
jgi:hypothetical protein